MKHPAQQPGIFNPERDISKHGVAIWVAIGVMIASLIVTYIAWTVY